MDFPCNLCNVLKENGPHLVRQSEGVCMAEMKLLDITQLSEILSVKPATIYGWVHDGFIPCIKLGRLVRFSDKDIQEWVNKRRRQGRSRKFEFDENRPP